MFWETYEMQRWISFPGPFTDRWPCHGLSHFFFFLQAAIMDLHPLEHNSMHGLPSTILYLESLCIQWLPKRALQVFGASHGRFPDYCSLRSRWRGGGTLQCPQPSFPRWWLYYKANEEGENITFWNSSFILVDCVHYAINCGCSMSSLVLAGLLSSQQAPLRCQALCWRLCVNDLI